MTNEATRRRSPEILHRTEPREGLAVYLATVQIHANGLPTDVAVSAIVEREDDDVMLLSAAATSAPIGKVWAEMSAGWLRVLFRGRTPTATARMLSFRRVELRDPSLH